MATRRHINFSSAIRDLRPARAVPLATASGFDLTAIMRKAVAQAHMLRRFTKAFTWAKAMAVGLKAA